MSEIAKTVGQLMVNNLSMTVIIILFILSGLFKITKKELDPIGKIVGWIGHKLTQDVDKSVSEVKTEVANLKTSTEKQFAKIETDRKTKIDELKKDYDDRIMALKGDIDAFEGRTNTSIDEMVKGTKVNCQELKKRIDQMEEATQKSNDLQTIRQIRAHVLDFANSCMNKRKHTKLDFENIIDENRQYKDLVGKYGIENDVYKEDYDFILKVYHKCQDEGSFLSEDEQSETRELDVG